MKIKDNIHIKRRSFIGLGIISLSGLALGCKEKAKDDDVLQVTPGNDTTAPTIESISPIDGTTDIAVDTTLTVTFSESMDVSTITANTDGTDISGNIQISSDDFLTCVQMSSSIDSTADGIQFILTPASNLSFETTYKIKITTNIADSAGNALESEFLTDTGFTTATEAAVDPTLGSLEGFITAYQIQDNGNIDKGLEGVTVELWKSGTKLDDDLITDSAGKYSAINLDLGDYLVKASKVGYDNLAEFTETVEEGNNPIPSKRIEIDVDGDEAFRFGGLVDFGDSSAEVNKTMNLRNASSVIVDTCVTDSLGKYALKKSKSGAGYSVTSPDGTVNSFGSPTVIAQGVTQQHYTLT